MLIWLSHSEPRERMGQHNAALPPGPGGWPGELGIGSPVGIDNI